MRGKERYKRRAQQTDIYTLMAITSKLEEEEEEEEKTRESSQKITEMQYSTFLSFSFSFSIRGRRHKTLHSRRFAYKTFPQTT